MSSANVELVKGVFPSGGVDMVEAIADMSEADIERSGIDGGPFTEDFTTEFLSGQAGGDISPQARGVAGLAEGWANWLDAFETYVITPEDFIDAGDQVLMLVGVRARTERDGVEVGHSPAALFEVSEGKICRARFFLEREAAFEAAGLEPPPEGD